MDISIYGKREQIDIFINPTNNIEFIAILEYLRAMNNFLDISDLKIDVDIRAHSIIEERLLDAINAIYSKTESKDISDILRECTLIIYYEKGSYRLAIMFNEGLEIHDNLKYN